MINVFAQLIFLAIAMTATAKEVQAPIFCEFNSGKETIKLTIEDQKQASVLIKEAGKITQCTLEIARVNDLRKSPAPAIQIQLVQLGTCTPNPKELAEKITKRPSLLISANQEAIFHWYKKEGFKKCILRNYKKEFFNLR